MLTRHKLSISVAVVVVAVVIAIAAVIQFRRSETDPQKNLASAPKLILAAIRQTAGENVVIAKQLGFFRDQGLDVTVQPYPTGKLALAALLEGKADLAVTAETPIVFAALGGARFFVLATLYESGAVDKMIARRDRGIEKPADLAGKKLGTGFGTSSEFVQDSILAIHEVDPRSIVRVNLAPARRVDALLAGEVDAVTIFAPHSLELIKRLGNTAAVFSGKTIYTSTLNLVAREELVKQHPEVLRGVLAALLRANAFARFDSDRAVREVAQALALDEAVVKAEWNPLNSTVALNQSLIVSMEDQARWAIRRQLMEASAVPNFLNWIHADALAAIKPEAVSVIK